MAADPLYDPLGFAPAPKLVPVTRRPVWAGVTLVVMIGLVAAGWVVARRNQPSDQAVAVSTIVAAPHVPEVVPQPSEPKAAVQVLAAPAAAPSQPGSAVEVQNGVKIIRFSPAASSASITVPVNSAVTKPLTAAPDRRLAEKTAGGVLPRIGADGSRPAEVYARPPAVTTGPRAAVLLVDMGRDQMATAEAARRLPPDMTFAFAPDTADAGTQVVETRRAGHEVFLDLTGSTAGSAADAPAEAQAVLGRMARIVGYAGALLDPSSAETTGHVMQARGVATIASAGEMPSEAANPSAGADLVIDPARGDAAVAAGIDRLTALARSKGTAVAIVHYATDVQASLIALPDMLAAKGVTLVPVSALIGRRAGASSSATKE